MKFTENIVSERFVAVSKGLKERALFKSFSKFAESLDFSPQSLNEILKNRRDVTIETLRKFFIIYQIDPQVIFYPNSEQKYDDFLSGYLDKYMGDGLTANVTANVTANGPKSNQKVIQDDLAQCPIDNIELNTLFNNLQRAQEQILDLKEKIELNSKLIEQKDTTIKLLEEKVKYLQ